MIQYNVPNINSIYYFISQMNTLVGKKCKPYKNTNMNKCVQRFKCFLSLTFSDSFTDRVMIPYKIHNFNASHFSASLIQLQNVNQHEK